jgi:hypothetical protein
MSAGSPKTPREGSVCTRKWPGESPGGVERGWVGELACKKEGIEPEWLHGAGARRPGAGSGCHQKSAKSRPRRHPGPPAGPTPRNGTPACQSSPLVQATSSDRRQARKHASKQASNKLADNTHTRGDDELRAASDSHASQTLVRQTPTTAHSGCTDKDAGVDEWGWGPRTRVHT